jgi:hypothetical protein
VLYPPLAQLCSWYSWMHRDQASLAINPLTRCLFTSREKEASTPVIIPSHHITFSLLEVPRINILFLRRLSMQIHASLPLLQTVGYGHPIISHPTLRRSRVCHSSHPLLSRLTDFSLLLHGPSGSSLVLHPSVTYEMTPCHSSPTHNYLFRKNFPSPTHISVVSFY